MEIKTMPINKLKEKDILWKITNSWHIIFTFFMGLLSWLTFLYMYIKGKKKSWLISSIVYGICMILVFYFTSKYPDNKTRPDYIDNFIYFYLFVWIISIIHSFISLKEFWLRKIIMEELDEKNMFLLETNIKNEMGLIKNSIEKTLLEYKEEDHTVKICKFIFDNVPTTPDFYFYRDISSAIKRYSDNITPELLKNIRNTLDFNSNLQSILKTAQTIDKVDGALSFYSGLKNTYEILNKKDRKRTFESDPQQALDAGLKTIALFYIINQTSENNSFETFLKIKAGKELLYYFLVIELALPFTDNLIEEGGKFIYKLLHKNESKIQEKFVSFANYESYQNSINLLEKMEKELDTLLTSISKFIKPFEDQLTNKLPKILNVSDSVTGGIATYLDILPIWKFLGARVAMEAAIYKELFHKN